MPAELLSAPTTGNHTIFLSGPPGSGKTTLAVKRLLLLLQRGTPAEQILVMVPQRTLASPYYDALNSAASPAGRQVDIATIGGLARRTIDLFWPLVAEKAGFGQPRQRPRFLTLETAQYYMDRVAAPFVADGAFDGITISRIRLISEIIDNLNKAAAVGFPLEEIAVRLKAAWGGEEARLRIYEQVQAVAIAFRKACLAESLLDWSLQIDLFREHLLALPQLRRYLLSGYRHLIVDNTEEDIPAAHDLLRTWLALCESALVICDTDGGYRVFLGADPPGALTLSSLCREQLALTESHVTSADVAALGLELATPVGRALPPIPQAAASQALVLPASPLRFYPQMLDWVAEQISHLVDDESVPPGEIAVLAPFLSDALRFSLSERLAHFGIAVRTHRPSRELSDEPAARSLLTLAKLAHPGWLRPPPATDVAHALGRAVAELDPARAQLLTSIVYRVEQGQPRLLPFHQIVSETQERVTYLLGGRYDELQQWIEAYRESSIAEPPPGDELDFFLSRLFGEILSQPGFGFHGDLDAGAVASSLIESIQKFRQGFSPLPASQEPKDLGLEYLDMVEHGVVAAQYVSTWQIHPENAVLLVPAYTFLMMNEPCDVQFWLDAGSLAWSERIYQPLTHPYVLRRDWPEGKVWVDEDEQRVREEALTRLVLGLSRRCRRCLYLAYSELNERGYEQQGPLLQAVQRLLRRRGAVGR